MKGSWIAIGLATALVGADLASDPESPTDLRRPAPRDPTIVQVDLALANKHLTLLRERAGPEAFRRGMAEELARHTAALQTLKAIEPPDEEAPVPTPADYPVREGRLAAEFLELADEYLANIVSICSYEARMSGHPESARDRIALVMRSQRVVALKKEMELAVEDLPESGEPVTATRPERDLAGLDEQERLWAEIDEEFLTSMETSLVEGEEWRYRLDRVRELMDQARVEAKGPNFEKLEEDMQTRISGLHQELAESQELQNTNDSTK